MAAINEIFREKKLTKGIDDGVKFWIFVSWLRRAQTGGSEDDGRMARRVKLRPPCIGLSTMLAILVLALGVSIGLMFMGVNYIHEKNILWFFLFE